MTLIEFITDLLGDDRMQLRESFQKDPQAVLSQYGFGHLTVEDVGDAMVLVRDNDTVGFHAPYNGPEWTEKEELASAITGQWRDHTTTDIVGCETTTDQQANQAIAYGDGGGPGHDSTDFGDGDAGRDIETRGVEVIPAGSDPATPGSPFQPFGVDDAATGQGASGQDATASPADHPSHIDVASHDDVGLYFG